MITDHKSLPGLFREHWNLLVILGPTASGKTGLAVRLARRIGGEILSADSRQVYRGMDLGTGKDLSEYGRGGDAVPFHLIDLCAPSDEFNLFAFQRSFYLCFQQIAERGKIPILAGGTGLYLDSVLRGYRLHEVPEDRRLREDLAEADPEALIRRLRSASPDLHNTTDLLDRERLVRAIEIAEYGRKHPETAQPPVNIAPLVIGVRYDRTELRRRIAERLQSRLDAGMIDEVRRLHDDSGISWERLDAFGLEYRYVGRYLQQKMTQDEMCAMLNTRIGQFAKRQETWFRKMEKSGLRIHWMEGADEDAAMALISRLIE